MHLRSCEHPKRVYNKYIDDYVWVGCGECPSCKRRRAARWIQRLECERRMHPVCMFVTLTYNNEHLPKLHLVGDDFVSDDGLICIPHSDFKFSTSADAELFRNMMALGGIPYANVRDIQLFHKRLNKYIHDNITHKYQNFRYFSVSEFGSTLLRPHWHCIYYLDSWEVAEKFETCILEAWKRDSSSIGIVDVQFIESSATSYVANYLNELFSLPSFYEHRSIRPLFVCSKRPPIGSYNEFSASDEEIFSECLVECLQPSLKSDSGFVSAPLHSAIENRLFPRLPYYSQIPDYAKPQLYRLCFQPFVLKWPKCSFFESWLCAIKSVVKLKPERHRSYCFIDYISQLAEGFCERGINRLKRVYYISQRVCKYAYKFGVSVHEYVNHIDEYWSKKQLMCLKRFYEFQSQYVLEHPSDEIAYAYPEHFHQSGFDDEGTNYCIPLADCKDIEIMHEEASAWRDLNTKTHFKNAYFQAQKDKNNPMFKPLLKYYYAKECNEIIEAYGKLFSP